MKKGKSFAKLEQDVRDMFRRNLGEAESVEDVKKFFTYAVKHLFDAALENKVTVDHNDFWLDSEQAEGFSLSEHLLRDEAFQEAWNYTDLRQIVRRMAETAHKHFLHFEKHRDKTERKMYPTPSHGGQRFSNPPATKKR